MDNNLSSSIAVGIATGAATGAAVAAAQSAEKESKKRRRANMGKDQVVFETSKDIAKIGYEIANLSDKDGYYFNEKDNKIYIADQSKWSAGFFGVGLCISAIILTIWFIISLTQCDTWGTWKHEVCLYQYPFNFATSLVISAFVGLLFGFFKSVMGDSEVDTIRLSKINKGNLKTRVLVKVYDSNGERNIDEDKLIEIEDLCE